MTVEKLPTSKPPPHPGRMAAPNVGKVTPLGYRLIGSRFQIEAELWTVTAEREGKKDGGTDSVQACLHEWTVLRDQTPNPEHVEAVRRCARFWGEATDN